MACSLCRREGHNRSTCSLNPQIIARNQAQAKKYTVVSAPAPTTTAFRVPAWRASRAGNGYGQVFYAGARVVVLSPEKLTCLDRTTGRVLSTTQDVRALASTAEGRLLVTDGSRVSWHDVEHPLCILPDSELVMNAALHAPTLRLAIEGEHNSVSCFDIRAGARVWRTSRVWGALRERSGPREMAFDSTGAHLALLGRDDTLTIRETRDGKVTGKRENVQAFAWHPSGEAVVVHHNSPYPGQLRLLNLSLDAPYWHTFIDMGYRSALLAFTPDGSLLAAAESTGAKLFQSKDGDVLAAEPLSESTTAIALAVWNRRLALAAMDSDGDVVQRDVGAR